MTRSNRVGMPATLYLQEFGQKAFDAFGEIAYHVGSSLHGDRDPKDVDVRLILSDADFEARGFGAPSKNYYSKRWAAVCMAWSAFGEKYTGLPIDFQVQPQHAAANEKGPRSALIIVREDAP